MLELDELYDIIVKEYPQLAPYTRLYRDQGAVCVGLSGDESGDDAIYANAIVITQERMGLQLARGRKTRSRKNNLTLARIISVIRPLANDILRMIQDFEKTAHPKREYELLESLGFERDFDDSSIGYLEDEYSNGMFIESPYIDYPLSGSRFGGVLNVHQNFDLKGPSKYFNTLDELLDYVADGGM